MSVHLVVLAVLLPGCAAVSTTFPPGATPFTFPLSLTPTTIATEPFLITPTSRPNPTLLFPPNDLVLDLAFSPDGSVLAVAAGNAVHLYDATTLQERATLATGVWVNRIAFHPTLPLLALAGKDGAIQFWHVDGSRMCRLDKAERNGVTALAFTPDGNLLASTGNNNVSYVWKTAPLMAGVCDLPSAGWIVGNSHASSDVAIRAKGDMLALVDVHDIRLRDPVTRKLIATLKGGASPIFRLAFSPDGTLLADGEINATVRLWDIHDPKQPAAEVLAPEHPIVSTFVDALAFSPDGTRLAAGASDGTIVVWDVPAQSPVVTFQHGPGVSSLAFSPDGLWLVSGGLDAAVRFWKIK